MEFSSDCKWPNENKFFPIPDTEFLCLRIPASAPQDAALPHFSRARGRLWSFKSHCTAPRPPGPAPLASRTETGAQETLTKFRRKAAQSTNSQSKYLSNVPSDFQSRKARAYLPGVLWCTGLVYMRKGRIFPLLAPSPPMPPSQARQPKRRDRAATPTCAR